MINRGRRQLRGKPARAKPLGLRAPRPHWSRPTQREHSPRRLDLTQLLTLGAVLVTLVLTIPQLKSSQATLEATRSQARNLEQQQITERFSKAVEQLGNRESLEVRVGGIYALGRIARDSTADKATVIDVLSTFVQEHTNSLRSPQGWCFGIPNDQPAPSLGIKLPADVQASLTVLGRRLPNQETPEAPVDLSGSCLYGADLRGAELSHVNLKGTNLNHADLTGANLEGARLDRANLSGTNLRQSDLKYSKIGGSYLNNANLSNSYLYDAWIVASTLDKTDLTGAHLTGTFLEDVNLTGSHLADANLSNALLVTANLRDADITDAVLAGVDLTRADLTGAVGVPR